MPPTTSTLTLQQVIKLQVMFINLITLIVIRPYVAIIVLIRACQIQIKQRAKISENARGRIMSSEGHSYLTSEKDYSALVINIIVIATTYNFFYP